MRVYKPYASAVSKTKVRRFRLRTALYWPAGIYDKWAGEVIEGIENDNLFVFDVEDSNALSLELDENDCELLLKRATVQVSAKQWLPVGCQLIRYENSDEDFDKNDCIACYKTNAPKVLWPAYSEYKPEGPAALTGEIILNKKRFASDLIKHIKKARYETAFKGIIAHELVHVFNALRFIVPAFIHWGKFWNNIVDEGGACDVLASKYGNAGIFVDQYGRKNELLSMQEFWPSKAKNWFNAMKWFKKQL